MFRGSSVADDDAPHHVPRRHGVSVDGFSNPSVPLRKYPRSGLVVCSINTHQGGVPPYIYADIGGADRWVWFVLANLLALAAVCPFVGALSDLVGRRWVAITGTGLVVLGMIVVSTSHNMNVFIGKFCCCWQMRIRADLNSGNGYCWCWCGHQ